MKPDRTYSWREIGEQVSRHSSWSPSARGFVSTIALLSSVRSLSEYAQEAGVTLDDGERARILEIPVNSRGGKTIFHWFPKEVTQNKRDA